MATNKSIRIISTKKDNSKPRKLTPSNTTMPKKLAPTKRKK